jgi:hypothetical protein
MKNARPGVPAGRYAPLRAKCREGMTDTAAQELIRLASGGAVLPNGSSLRQLNICNFATAFNYFSADTST